MKIQENKSLIDTPELRSRIEALERQLDDLISVIEKMQSAVSANTHHCTRISAHQEDIERWIVKMNRINSERGN